MTNIHDLVMISPDPSYTRRKHILILVLHLLKKEVVQIKRKIIPCQKTIKLLITSQHRFVLSKIETDKPKAINGHKITELSRTYFKDVSVILIITKDHLNFIVDEFKFLQISCKSLIEITFNTLSYSINHSLEAFTIVSTIFWPITFFASYFGMNIRPFPELL